MAKNAGAGVMTMNHALVYSPDMPQYKFNDDHPFSPLRQQITFDLLLEMGAISDSQLIPSRMATDEEIMLVHDQHYVEAVKVAGKGELSIGVANNYGLGTEDTPIFDHMHEASATLVGGTLQAVETVLSGKASHAFHLGGGLHHGFQGKASGFCVYNDSAIAIEYARKHFGARVLYVDTDAHHGDGVQFSFYEEPDVCTLSIHETGRYLFPGTGSVGEKGAGQGYGTSINIPVDAFTEDDSFLHCYETALREAAEFFKPDVIFTLNGADAHYFDPLTHLSLSIESYKAIPAIAHQVAHEYCEGRWIAVGGGGYDMWRVVPRAWAAVWLEMSEQTQLYEQNCPEEWRGRWGANAPIELPTKWQDPEHMYAPIPRRPEIEEKNIRSLEKALFHIRNEKRP